MEVKGRKLFVKGASFSKGSHAQRCNFFQTDLQVPYEIVNHRNEKINNPFENKDLQRNPNSFQDFGTRAAS